MYPPFLLLFSLLAPIRVGSFSPAAQQQPIISSTKSTFAPHVQSLTHITNNVHSKQSHTLNSHSRRLRKSVHVLGSTSSSAAAADADEPPILGGTQQFQSWFQSKSVGGKSLPEVKHASFQSNTLRGLQYDGTKNRGLVEVPEKVVLRTEYNRNTEGGKVDADWDSRLAVMLVKECLKGGDSDLFGYCSLLTRGIPFNSVDVPPPTAPDALRHWTTQQKARLKASSRGERLLKKEKSQLKAWSDKYDAVPAEDKSLMTKDQFIWGLEAVNSRAFKGNYGGGLLNQLQRLTIPIVAAAFGAIVLLAQPGDETADLIAQICGLLVLGPALIGLVEEGSMGPGSSKADAVLLPYIDSANHSDDAESNIEYDPVNGIFILDIGKNCKVKEDDDRTQVYINYGRRSDSDLLLNYGFLTGMDDEQKGGGESLDEDQRRARLAKEFVRRNP